MYNLTIVLKETLVYPKIIVQSTNLRHVIFFKRKDYLLTPHCLVTKTKSSRSQMFFKNSALKNFAIFKGKYLCWSLILIKLQAFRPATLLKRDSKTGAFLRMLTIF